MINSTKNLVNSIIKGVFKRKLTVMTTFNGIGAFTESMKLLKLLYKMIGICEIDESTNKTYYKNNKYIHKIHTNDINDLLKTVKQGLLVDILIQTPPCQSFSIQGKRFGLNSDNGNLFLTSINLQKKINSNIVIYENVKGLLSHHKINYIYENENGERFEFDSKPKKKEIEEKKLNLVKKVDLSSKSLINSMYDGKKKSIGHTLQVIEKELLEDTRYNYYWKVINSCDQGFPQNRERIFIIGIKKELDTGFEFPQNIDIKFTVEDILQKKVPQNFYYKNNEGHELVVEDQQKRDNKIHTYGKYSETMTYESTRRVSYPYISPCITTGGQNKFLIKGKIRTLTPTEMKRVHGFSEEFKFVGNLGDQRRQLGNTVSPGVYVNLLTQILDCVDFTKENTKPLNQDKHRTFTKKISNKQDLTNLNLTQKQGDELIEFLNSGGTVSMSVELSNTYDNKVNGIVDEKYIVDIHSITQKSIRNKKQKTYRYKIDGSYSKVEKVSKQNVLTPKPGSKNKFTEQIDNTHNKMNIKNKKIDCVVDGFFGGGSYTFRHIDNFDFKRYIINDLDPLIYKTFLGIKYNHTKVLKVYQELNEKFLLIEDIEERRKFYNSYIHILNDSDNLDIYTISGIYIFITNRTLKGLLKYKKDRMLNTGSFGKGIMNKGDKTNMIINWSYLLNSNKIEIMNKDIFEILEDNTISNNSFVYLDPPYLDTDYNYGFDNSESFQIKLLKHSQRFDYRLYSNEDCEILYRLNIPSYFDTFELFERKIGCEGKEFLGVNSKNSILKNKNTSNNINYQQVIQLVS